MPNAQATSSRFQMVGARAAILSGPVAEFFDQQIQAIEQALDSIPDFAFDLSKTFVESVCKTVLTDIGQPADPNWNCPKLLRETIGRLSLMPQDHPDPAQGRDSIKTTLNGLMQTIQGLCELRNNYGMASHGRDGFSARLGIRQATLAAQAADTIVAFLYCMHRDALAQVPGSRIYYADHQDFNDSFDEDNELVKIGVVGLLPSRVLFHTDREAYKAALNDFINSPDVAEDEGTTAGSPPEAPV